MMWRLKSSTFRADVTEIQQYLKSKAHGDLTQKGGRPGMQLNPPSVLHFIGDKTPLEARDSNQVEQSLTAKSHGPVYFFKALKV